MTQLIQDDFTILPRSGEAIELALAESETGPFGPQPVMTEERPWTTDRTREISSSPSLRASLAVARDEGITPQRLALAEAAAVRLGLPRSVALADLEYARDQADALRIELDGELARWAAKNPENAALSRDDEGLSGVFNAAANFGTNVRRSLHHGVADFSLAFYGAGLSAAELLAGEKSFAADVFRSALAANERARPAPVVADTKLGQFGYDFLRSVPQQVGNIVAYSANPAAALALMGIQIGGSSYVNLREQGVSPKRAAGASALNATLQAPMERLGLGRFMNIFRSSTFRDTAVRTLGAMATEGLTEYVQKYPEVATELWGLAEKQSPDASEQLRWFADKLTDADTLLRAHYEGLYEAAIGSVWGLLGGGARSLAIRNRERQTAEEFSRQNIALHDAVEASETKRLAPEHMADALESASDVLAQSVFIPARAALELSEQGRDVLTPLGISIEQAQRAAESDIDLEVKLSEVHSRLDAESMAVLAPLLRQRADAPNALEAEQMDNAAQAQAVVEESRVRQRVADAVRQEEKRLVSEMTPLAGKKAAETFGALHTARARAFETAYGVDAAGLLRRVRIERGEGTARDGEIPLNQAAMYRSRETDIDAFVNRVLAEAPDAKKSYFVLRDVTAPRAGFNRVSVELASDQVRHDTNRHPDNTIWGEIPDVIERGEVFSGRSDPVTGEKSIIFVRRNGETADVVMGTIVRGKRGKKGKEHKPVLRFRVGTAFRDKAKAVKNWMDGKRDAKPFPSDEEITSYPRQEGVPYGSGHDIPGKAPALYRDRPEIGEITQPADAISDVRLGVLRGNVKPSGIKNGRLYQPEAHGDAAAPRAQVTLDAETAAIRIFKGADLSSIPHESAHIFVDDLRRVAADDGSMARERLRSDLEQAGMDVTPFAGILSGEVDAERARAMLRDEREELAMLDDSDAGLRAAEKVPAKSDSSREGLEEIRAALKANAARRRELLPVERRLSAYVRHLDGLEQAKRDMATLRRFAGVAEDGELTDAQWREVQEYAARGFEQYLMEGKAPSKELQGVFSRMMRWIKQIYRSFRQMGDYVGRELNDDVRRVFDRLLAAEDDVRENAANRAALETEADFLADADLTLAERAELEELRGRAEAEVTAALERSTARERGKRYRAAFDEAKRSLQDAPFWRFVAEMTRREPALDGGPNVGGIRRDSLVEYLGEDMTRDIARKMPRLINARGGGSLLDTLALEYHLTDGDADALAQMIYDAVVVNDGSVNKLAARMAQQTLEEQDRQADADAGLLAGEAYGGYLAAVEKAMRRLYKERQAQNEQAAAQRMERESLPESYYRKLARREIGGLPVERLSAGRYEAALRRALEARTRALRLGKPLEAVRAMQRARMAFALMREARTARQMVDRVRNTAVRAARVKPGTYPAAQTEAIRKLNVGLGLSGPSAPHDADAAGISLEKLVEQSIGDTSAIDIKPLFPDWLLRLKNPDAEQHRRGVALSWKKLLPDEVEQVGNLIDFLVHSAREQSRADKNSLRSRVEAVADAAAANMSGLKTFYPGERDSVRSKLDRGWSSIDSVEWLSRKADGFQNVMGRKTSTEGVMERDVYMRLREGTNRYHARLAGTQRAVTPHLVRLLQSAKKWERKYGWKYLNIRDEAGNVLPVPELLRRVGVKGWTAETVISMALNMGNSGNRERLRSSYRDENGNGGLTFNDVSLLLGDDAAMTLFGLDTVEAAALTQGRARRDGILSAEDWKAIQGVWDVFGSQWADTQAAHKKLYGFAPQGIEPGAFVVRVGDEAVDLAGGYYPIRYDSRLDTATQAREEKADILERSESIAPIPAARRGFTMQRVAHTGKSLRLDVSGLQQHLADSARFIELGYDVRMADKIIMSPAFAAEYQRAFGMDEYSRWRPNLKGLVVDEADPDSGTWQAAEWARKGLTYYALALNFKTAFLQLTALSPAIGDVGAANVARGLAQLSTQGMGLVRSVWQASPYMARRFRNMDADLARKAMRFSPGRGFNIIYKGKVYTWENIADLGMLPIALADCIATTAIWSGAYHKKMKALRGASGWKIDRDAQYHAEAVAYADKIIAQSNPDNDALSKSAFGRDKGVIRMFNIFSGSTTKFAQRTRYMWQGVQRGKVTPWEFARMEMYDKLLTAVAIVVGVGLAQGLFTGEDDDNKELAKLALTTTLGQGAMAVPQYGNLLADTFAAAAGSGTGRRAGLETPLETPIELGKKLVIGGGESIREGELGDRMLLHTLDAASFMSKIPVVPAYRRARRGYDQWQRGDGTPLSIIMPRPGK